MVAAVGLIVIGLAFIISQLLQRQSGVRRMQAFYSTDDGATIFADDAKMPPFDRGGAQAVQAFVFSCDGGKHRWVQYLMKFSDKALKQTEMHESLTAPDYGACKEAGNRGMGGGRQLDGCRIKEPKCPADQGSGQPQMVYP